MTLNRGIGLSIGGQCEAAFKFYAEGSSGWRKMEKCGRLARRLSGPSALLTLSINSVSLGRLTEAGPTLRTVNRSLRAA